MNLSARQTAASRPELHHVIAKLEALLGRLSLSDDIDAAVRQINTAIEAYFAEAPADKTTRAIVAGLKEEYRSAIIERGLTLTRGHLPSLG